MKTGLSKKQKVTNIYFNEADSMIEVCTYISTVGAGLFDIQCTIGVRRSDTGW